MRWAIWELAQSLLAFPAFLIGRKDQNHSSVSSSDFDFVEKTLSRRTFDWHSMWFPWRFPRAAPRDDFNDPPHGLKNLVAFATGCTTSSCEPFQYAENIFRKMWTSRISSPEPNECDEPIQLVSYNRIFDTKSFQIQKFHFQRIKFKRSIISYKTKVNGLQLKIF